MCMRPGFRITRYELPRRFRPLDSPSRQIRNGLYLAFSKSFLSPVHTGKHCAVLFDKHLNIVKTFVNCHRPGGEVGTIHAEEGLIESVLRENPEWDFRECTILVVRGNKLGEFSNSIPCDKCLSLMKKNRVGRIICTIRKNDICAVL